MKPQARKSRKEGIVKGYSMGKNQYVILEEEDFKKATPEKQDHLEIVQFINEKEIDAALHRTIGLAGETTNLKPSCGGHIFNEWILDE